MNTHLNVDVRYLDDNTLLAGAPSWTVTKVRKAHTVDGEDDGQVEPGSVLLCFTCASVRGGFEAWVSPAERGRSPFLARLLDGPIVRVQLPQARP